MARSEIAISHARVTGKDYTLADNDRLILHVTAQGEAVALSLLLGRQAETHVLLQLPSGGPA